MWDPSSPTRDWAHVPCIARWILNHWTPGKSRNSLPWVSLFLLLATKKPWPPWWEILLPGTSVPPPGCFSESHAHPSCAWGGTQLCAWAPSPALDGLWLWGFRDPEAGRGGVRGYRVPRGVWRYWRLPAGPHRGPQPQMGALGGQGSRTQVRGSRCVHPGPTRLLARLPPCAYRGEGRDGIRVLRKSELGAGAGGKAAPAPSGCSSPGWIESFLSFLPPSPRAPGY